jgi:diketogulonate reductase-like aldo/keto reductase
MKTKNNYNNMYSRREASKLIAGTAIASFLTPSLMSFNQKRMNERKIPSTGELLPIVGLGTWQSFDIGNDLHQREQLSEVLINMNELGGKMIDSSPMYGRSETVVGELTTKLNIQNKFFYATKVWIEGKQQGIYQMNASFHKMKREAMDLMQVHNLVDWKTHIKTLKDWKEKGKIRYVGFTHYTNASHNTLVKLIRSERPDFVQFNYSINERNAEKELLNVAKEHGTAVIINRPYAGGALFRKIRGKALPEWCKEMEITSWGQYFLKFILANEAINCVIPGTSNPKHLIDNMKAGFGRLPNDAEKKRMLQYLDSL